MLSESGIGAINDGGVGGGSNKKKRLIIIAKNC